MSETLSIKAKIDLDGRGFEAGLARANKATSDFASKYQNTIKAAVGAAFATGAIATFGKHLLDTAGELQDNADAANVGTAAFQRYEKAALKVGVASSKVADQIAKINKAMSESLDVGSPDGAKKNSAFERFGVTREMRMAGDTEGVIAAMAGFMSSNPKTARSMRDLQEVAGKGAPRLYGMFQELGADGGRDRFGIDPATVASLDKTGDKSAVAARNLKNLSLIATTKLMDQFIKQFSLGVFDPAKDKAAARQKILDEIDKTKALNTEIALQENAEAEAERVAKIKVKKAPEFQLFSPQSQRGPASDSLTAVGNFLGSSGRSTMNSLTAETNRILLRIEQHISRNGGQVFSIVPK